MNDETTIQQLHLRNDKTFMLLSGLYDWINMFRPELVAEIPYALNAQILYMFGDIEYNDVRTWDDSIVTSFYNELSAEHESCIITGCHVCANLAKYSEWLEAR